MPCLKVWIELCTLYIVPRLQNIIAILLIMMMTMTMCMIIMVIIIHNVIRALGFLPCEQTFLSCMAFSIYEVICVACLWCRWFCLCPPRNGKRGVLTKSMAQQTSHANNFVNAKGNAREKLLLAGYGFPSIFLRAQLWKHYGARLNYYAFKFFFCSYILCSNALYNCYTVCVLQDNEHIFDCVLDCASFPRSFVRRPDVLETRHKVRDALLCLLGKT